MTRRFRLLCFSFPLETVGAPSLRFLQGRVTMLPALFFVLPSSLHRTSLAARNLQPYITDLGKVPSFPSFSVTSITNPWSHFKAIQRVFN
jgi:hypothetical protein